MCGEVNPAPFPYRTSRSLIGCGLRVDPVAHEGWNVSAFTVSVLAFSSFFSTSHNLLFAFLRCFVLFLYVFGLLGECALMPDVD